MATHSTTTAPRSSRDRPGTSMLLGATARAGIVALLANILLYLFARTAGLDLVLTPPRGETFEIPLTSVVTTTLAPIIIGSVLLVAACRYVPRGARSLPWIGLLIGLGTVVMPLSMDGDPASLVVLASMHVITGVAWFRSLSRLWG